MSEVTSLVKSDKIIRLGMMFSLLLLFFEAVLLAFFYLKLPPIVPLFNQLPWGDARLGAAYEIFVPLCLSAVYFIFNYFLLRKLYLAMPLVSRILSITTLLASVLSLIFIIRTLQLIL